MTNNFEGTGGCLCGAVHFTAKQLSTNVGACHCGMCQKWGGGPLMADDSGTAVLFSGEENISVFNSSQWAERGFCSKCGSSLFYKLKQNGQFIVPAGILNIEAELNFDQQIFIDSKPSFYCFSNETKNMTGAEVFAQFGSE